MADQERISPNLEEIERRSVAATAGPWQPFVEGRDHQGGDDFIRTGGLDDSAPDMYVSLGGLPAGAKDLDFIAHARQDIPDLVAALRQRMREERKERASGDSERALVDAQVDHGNLSGCFVRLDVEVPANGLWDREAEGPVSGYLWLTPDEAEDLGHLLIERASGARTGQADIGP